MYLLPPAVFPLGPGNLEAFRLVFLNVSVNQRDHLGLFLSEGDLVFLLVFLVALVVHKIAAEVEVTVDDVLLRHVGIAEEVVENQEHIGPSHTGLAVEVQPGVLRKGLDEGDEVLDAAGVGEAVVEYRQAEISYSPFGARLGFRFGRGDVELGGAGIAACPAHFHLVADGAVDYFLLRFDDLLAGQADVVPVLFAVERDVAAVQQAVGLVPQIDDGNGSVVVLPDLRYQGVQLRRAEIRAGAHFQVVEPLAGRNEVGIIAWHGAPFAELVVAGAETAGELLPVASLHPPDIGGVFLPLGGSHALPLLGGLEIGIVLMAAGSQQRKGTEKNDESFHSPCILIGVISVSGGPCGRG